MLANLKSKGVVALVIGLAVGLVGGYLVTNNIAYDKGYASAEADAKKLQEAAAAKAAEEAAKAANPFAAANPLESIESNPFEKTKKVLNPFE